MVRDELIQAMMLSERELLALSMYEGLFGNEKHTYKEMASKLPRHNNRAKIGISVTRASALVATATRKLRQPLRRTRVKSVLEKYDYHLGDDLRPVVEYFLQIYNGAKTSDPLTGEHSPDHLNLDVRVLNVLDSHRVTTISRLREITERDLLSWRGIGAKCVKEIKSALAEHGLSLHDDRSIREYVDGRGHIVRVAIASQTAKLSLWLDGRKLERTK